MSVWTEVIGTIKISSHAHFSIKNACFDIYDESIVKIEQDRELQHITWTFSEGGDKAVKCIKKLVEQIKEADKHADVDIEATIRFLT